jgi:putative acetyltransferase
MPQSEERSTSEAEIRIRTFRRGDESAFRSLNEEWITRHFRIEAKDEKTFADPQGTIIDHGGQIFFATIDDQCAGCCALLRMNETEFEVGKMAVSSLHQGSGIGRRLLRAVIEQAPSLGARRLYLETNHVLTPAIRLYESVGFRHIDPARITLSPYARTDVYMEMNLA